MTDPARNRWVWFAIALLVLSTVGIWNGWDEWPGAETPEQKLASLTEVGYGVLGMIGALAIYWGWAGARLVLWIWTLCLGVTAGLRPSCGAARHSGPESFPEWAQACSALPSSG